MSERKTESSGKSVLQRFRRSRSIRLLLIWACFCLQANHVLMVMAEWSDTDTDGFNDTWTDPGTLVATTLASMNTENTDADGDGASNDEEAVEGANPYVFDTDFDGLSDGDELHLARLTLPGLLLTEWDSDGDNISDYDEYHGFSGVVYTGGELPSFPGATYSDYDGDGIKNPDDDYPEDPTNNADADGDGITDSIDPFPADASNYSSVNGIAWYENVMENADHDSVVNGLDPFPNSSSNYSSINGLHWYGNLFGDADGDMIPNWQDPIPFVSTDNDGDGIENGVDPYPLDPNNYSSVNGISWYGDVLGDDDGDTILNWEDSTPYLDSDGDLVPDPFDPYPDDPSNISDINYVAWYGEVLADDDGDGLRNWEDITPFYRLPSDDDGDGLTSDYEQVYGTSDQDVDCDDDGLTDFEEVFFYGTDPLNAYSLSQADGWGNQFTDYQMVDMGDSDSDGLPNTIEVRYGLNPANAADAQGDLDANGISNLAQYQAGIRLNADLDLYDADGDGMTDIFEDFYSLAKNDARDAVADSDNDGVLNFEESRLNLSPRHANTRGLGGLKDLQVLMESVLYPSGGAPLTDSDSDGIPDWAEAALTGSNPHFTRLGQGDLDGDGMPDLWEHRHGRWKYPNGGLQFRVNDAQEDPDEDGLVNFMELVHGCHPLIGDSDGNGTSDGDQMDLTAGTPPADPAGGPPAVSWSGSQAGNNSGLSGSTPNRPAALGPGTAVDRSLAEWVYPVPGPNGETESAVFEGQWGDLYYHDYSLNQNPNFEDPDDEEGQSDHQVWWLIRGGQNQVGGEGAPPSLSIGSVWDRPYGEDIFTWIPPVASGGRGRPRGWGGVYNSDIFSPDYGILIGYERSNESWMTGGKNVRVCFWGGGAASRWWYHYFYKVKTITQDGVEVSRELLEKIRFVTGPGEFHSRQYAGLFPQSGSSMAEGQVETYSLETIDNSGDAAPGYQISASDAAGPSYRKVGLNGLPLADGKPQVQDESGERPEETFVDAFTRQLNYTVTDVYASVDSSLLPLSVKRSARENIWSLRSGLRPSELPDAPFGPGWSSNLCAHIRFEDKYKGNYRKAIVTDEQGATAVFFRVRVNLEDLPETPDVWVHSREEKQDARTAFDTLETIKNGEGVSTGWVYRKKYGTVCTYEATPVLQEMSTDREDGSYAGIRYQFARLTKAVDRWSNELRYIYPSDRALIPSKINDPDRPNQVVTISQQNGVVTAVRGPAGDTTTYNYSTQNAGDDLVRYLGSVRRGGATVYYNYETVTETTPSGDVDPNGPLPPDYRHFTLTRIIDELGRLYQFSYGFNHGNKYVEVSGEGTRTRSQLGLPRLVTSVSLPGLSSVNFSGLREIITQENGTLAFASIQTQVSGPCGAYTYTFQNPHVFVPLSNDPGKEDDPFSRQLTVYFTRMNLATPAGTEIYHFDFGHGMALSSVTDLSGNTTTFHYGGVSSPSGLGWDDPVEQVNALGQSRYFTYDAGTRVMKSITDERGVLTQYQIQSSTGLRTRETISLSGATVRITDFAYGGNGFKGFMTRKTVQNGSTGGDMVTTYSPDANGRVKKETVEAGGGIQLVTSYTYTGNGSKRTVTNPRGYVTTFEYHPQTLRLTGVRNPDGSQQTLGYDAHGNLTQETSETGVITTYVYDSLNRRTQSTLHMGGGSNVVRQTIYNAWNLPVAETDPFGIPISHTYDNLGRRLSTRTGSRSTGRTTSYLYGVNSGGSVFDVSGFMPTQVSDPRGNITQITYDGLYRPTQQTLPESNTVTTTYDASGNPVTVRDDLNRVTETTFDGLNRPTRVEFADGTSRNTYYTPGGLAWKSVDELGRETLTEYDRAGRPVEVTLPAVNGQSPVIKTAYDACGNVIAVRDALGHITTTVYDSRNRPTKVISPYVWDAVAGAWARPEVSTTYDAVGNVLTVTDPLGNTTTTTYNAANWPLTTTDALGQVTTLTYDLGGNVVTIRDVLHREVHNTYDQHNQLIETTDAAGQSTSFAYDKNGNRTSLSDPRGQVTTFTYDGLNRLLKETFPEGVWVEHTYDALRETAQEDSAGRVFAFGYDLRDRLTTKSWTEGGNAVTRTQSYDLAGNLLEVTETGRPEATVTYAYDALNRQVSETSQGLTHEHAYDLAGRRTQTVLGTGRTLTYTHDSQGKPLTVSEGGRSTGYYYDLGGRALAQVQANGAWQSNGYDALGRLTHRLLFDGDDVVQAQMFWTHDAVGNVTTHSERWPGEAARGAGWRSTAMSYDAVNRLVGEAVDEDGAPLRATGYAFDAGGNRVLKRVTLDGVLSTETTYTYNPFNQLLGWEEENGVGTVVREAALTYDDAGNRVSQTLTPAGQAGQVTTYHWNAENRLTGVTLPNAEEHEYGYDHRMRRIVRVEAGVGHAVVYNGGLSVAEYEDQGPTPVVEYLRGPDMGGGVGGMLYSLRGGQAKYALSNGRGDVVAQSNSSGDLTWTASYEAYGKRPVETGVNAERQRANTKEEDPTGLLNEGWRYRDLETGVWLSRDPAGLVDGPNLYAYVRQNPWSSFDPEGLAETKGYYTSKDRPGGTKLEAATDGKPLIRHVDGEAQVLAHHYEHSNFITGPWGEKTSAWEPAARYGVNEVTASAKRGFQEDWEGAERLKKGLGSAARSTGPTIQTMAEGSLFATDLISGGMMSVGKKIAAKTVGAADEMVYLYRAVGPEEFADVFKVKGFRPAPGGTSLAGKQFGHNLDEIVKLADHFPDAAAVIRARIPRSVFDQLDHTPVDPFILRSGATTVQPSQLDLFNNSILNLWHAF